MSEHVDYEEMKNMYERYKKLIEQTEAMTPDVEYEYNVQKKSNE